ncbi:MAG: hypothetical protein KIS78_20350 [Labilithrix sp.]|nr:hypothetical protein [Labilithrix sp.]
MTRPVAAILLSSSVLLAVACGGSPPPPPASPAEPAASAPAAAESRPSCDAIDEACDPHEDEPGLPKECHDLAESKTTTEATCAARKAECLAACPPVAKN